MGVRALVNALAFSGGNAFFNIAPESERKEMDTAKEKFQEDLAAWNQRKAAREEFLATSKQEAAEASDADSQTLSTLRIYQQYVGPNNNIPIDQNADPAPTLTSFMPEPSVETKTAEIIGIILGMSLTSFLAYKIGQHN